jgi:hypothetical protein
MNEYIYLFIYIRLTFVTTAQPDSRNYDEHFQLILTTSLRTSSGTFLEELHSANAEEWENMTGALLAARASFMVRTDAWDKSTIMPRRFISRTTSWNQENYRMKDQYARETTVYHKTKVYSGPFKTQSELQQYF